jgi:hypothetical protein
MSDQRSRKIEALAPVKTESVTVRFIEVERLSEHVRTYIDRSRSTAFTKDV